MKNSASTIDRSGAGLSGMNYKDVLCDILGIERDTPEDQIRIILERAITENANSKKGKAQNESEDVIVKMMSARLGAQDESFIMASQPAADEYIRRRLGISKEVWAKHQP